MMKKILGFNRLDVSCCFSGDNLGWSPHTTVWVSFPETSLIFCQTTLSMCILRIWEFCPEILNVFPNEPHDFAKQESNGGLGVANTSCLLVLCPAWPHNDVHPFWTAELLCVFPESAVFLRKAGFADMYWPSEQHACRRAHAFWRKGTHYTQAYFFTSNVKCLARNV